MLFRSTWLFYVMLLFALLVAGMPVARAQSSLLVWGQVGGVPPNVTLHGVQMIDQNNAWAVGGDEAGGYVYRLQWQNNRWVVTLETKATAPLYAVTALGNNVWAAGDQGVILHKDAAGWHTRSSNVPGASLRTIQMLGNGQEGWAGGQLNRENAPTTAVLLHYKDGAWQQDQTVSGEGTIPSIRVASGTVWVLHQQLVWRSPQEPPQSTAWRYRGGRWTSERTGTPCEVPGCSASVSDLWVVDAEEAWTVGNSRSNCSFCFNWPYFRHRVGGTWQPVSFDNPSMHDLLYPPGTMPWGGSYLNAISFSDRNHGLFAGGQTYGRDTYGYDQPLLIRYTNGTWTRETVPLGGGTLYDVSQLDPTHALAVGMNGRIFSYGYGPTALSTPPSPSNGSFADTAFRGAWERTDRPVAANPRGLQPRSWIWGMQPLTAAHQEPYAEAPGGMRLVQYFDKSRMEITQPGAERNQWYVTNGLLVMEMMTGRLQVGDNLFERRIASQQAVAGDPVEINRDAPTYSLLQNVAYPNRAEPAPRRTGQVVTAVFEGSGTTRDDPGLARYNVTLDAYEEKLGHNIPKVFTDFFKQQGLVYENGRYVQGQVFDWLFVMGLPVMEPYWTRVKVGGVEKDVLMQAFERRVLTYTPDNPEGFKVEMGNVGQHYLRWRYDR